MMPVEANKNPNCYSEPQKQNIKNLSFTTDVDQNIRQRIFSYFNGKPDGKIISSIEKLLQGNTSMSAEFKRWKTNSLGNPPKELMELNSTQNQNILIKNWENNFLTTFVECINNNVEAHKLKPYQRLLKLISRRKKGNEEADNLFLQELGKLALQKDCDYHHKPTGQSQTNLQQKLPECGKHQMVARTSEEQPKVHNPVISQGNANPEMAGPSFTSRHTGLQENKVINSQIGSSKNGAYLEGKYQNDTKRNETRNKHNATPPEEIVILLLGETGAGKTTFINGLVNYLLYEDFESAFQGKTEILSDIFFTITNEEHELKEVRETSIFNDSRNFTNEKLIRGQSCTQEPIVHSVNLNRKGTNLIIKIIDTPGVNDTRGFEQDKKNFDKIFNHLRQFRSIHAICFVMKPNESKLKTSFLYCLNSFLNYFHKNAVNNILFCFTNTRSLLYRPGDTLAPLDIYLKKLWDERGIKIKIDKSNTFCFDNDSFRYLLARKKEILPKNEQENKIFADGWLHNVNETKRFLQKTRTLSVFKTEDSVQIKESVELVNNLAGHLGQIAKTMLENMNIIDENKTTIRNMEKEGTSLSLKLIEERFFIYMVPVYECLHKYCPNRKYGHCKDWRETYSQCPTCKCRIEHRTTLEQHKIRKHVQDQRIVNELDKLDIQTNKAETQLKKLEKEYNDLNTEYDTIRDFCAEAAIFVKEYSIKPPLDRFREVLASLVDEENGKSNAQNGFTEMFYQVSALLQDYEEIVKDIQSKISNGEQSVITNEELKTKLSKLETLPSFGEQIKSAIRYHRQSIKQKQRARLDNNSSNQGGVDSSQGRGHTKM